MRKNCRNGWTDTQTPHLLQTGGATNTTIIAVSNGTTARYYDLVNDVYQPRHDDPSQLVYNSNTDVFTLSDGQGDQLQFNGFASSWPTAQRGSFASFIDPNGNTTQVTAYTSSGQIGEVERSTISNGNTITESYLYSYLPSTDANAGLLNNVTLRRQTNGGAWSIVRQVAYTYYDGTQQYGGSLGNLMTATVEDGNDNAISTSYYRYYQSGEANGYTNGLKYVFNPQSYARLTAALGTNLGSLTFTRFANRTSRAATILADWLGETYTGASTATGHAMCWSFGRLQWCWTYRSGGERVCGAFAVGGADLSAAKADRVCLAGGGRRGLQACFTGKTASSLLPAV